MVVVVVILFVLFLLFGGIGKKRSRRGKPKTLKTKRSTPSTNQNTSTAMKFQTTLAKAPSAVPPSMHSQFKISAKAAPSRVAFPAGTVMPSNFSPGQSVWVPKGTQISVAGHLIPGGMVYVGTQGRGTSGPAGRYIDPTLPVAKALTGTATKLSYYPDYRTVTPEQRRSYLGWMAGGRSDQSLEIGYIFLFYYGLEQRIATLACTSQEEMQILKEIVRLRRLYGSNKSFEGYSRNFCDALLARQHCRNPELAATASLDLTKLDPRSSQRHVAAVARFIGEKQPLDFQKAYSATLIQEFGVKSVSPRLARFLKPEVIATSKAVFERKWPNGFLPETIGLKPLIINYRPAMGYGNGPLNLALSTDYPPAADLSSYDWSELWAAFAQVEAGFKRHKSSPVASYEGQPEAKEAASVWLEQKCDPVGISSFQELANHVLASTNNPDRKLGYGCLENIMQIMGYGLEPQAASLKGPMDAADIVAFFAVTKQDLSEEFQAVSCINAYAMQRIERMSPSDLDLLITNIVIESVSAFNLNGDEYIRLQAQILHAQKAAPEKRRAFSVKSLRALDTSLQLKALHVLLSALSKGNLINKTEVQDLEALFDALKLPKTTLYTNLHAAAANILPRADGMMQVSAGGSPNQAYKIPRPAKEGPPSILLDRSKISAIQEATGAVQEILDSVLPGAEPDEGPSPPPLAPNAAYEGLRPGPAALVAKLVMRSEWVRADFETAARAVGQMPDGAIETINEWAYDKFDEPLIEEGDKIIINIGLLA